jgi:uncharacterized damage-inducible protein DinB
MDGLTEAALSHFADLHERMRKVIADLDTGALTRAPAAGENSIAVLVTHTLGSEMGWLHRAAGVDFARDRDSEFSKPMSSSSELANAIDRTEARVRELVDAAAERGYETAYRTNTGQEITVGYCVVHALAHAAEHVGHAELTRGILSKAK